MFRLIQTSDTRGDCTASCDVQLDKEYTVKEFVPRNSFGRTRAANTKTATVSDLPGQIF